MNWDLISLIIFYFLLMLFYFTHKQKFEVQGKIFFLCRTKIGIKLMEKLAKYNLLKHLASIGVFVGFAGMLFIFVFLIIETVKMLFVPGTPPALAPVLPGIEIEGAPDLSFWHWIIAIFITAAIHEFAHGVVSKCQKIKIKSSGFAFFGPILAAFVEPDEKQLTKAKTWDQLRIYAAGPAINIFLGVLLFGFMIFVMSPVIGGLYDAEGLTVNTVLEGYPMEDFEVPFTIYSINGDETLDAVKFLEATEGLEPGDEVVLGTDSGEYTVILAENPENRSVGFFGVSGFEQESVLKENYSWLSWAEGFIQWIVLLTIWLFLINIGIGLFNLLPLGPVDGGRMFYAVSLALFKNEKKAHKAFVWISLFVLGLIVINMLPWIQDLLMWIFGLLG